MRESTCLSPECPQHIVLIALAEGTLSAAEVDNVSSHVTGCAACEARLDQIEEQSDWLVQALAAQPPSEDDEETFRQVQAKLLAHPELFQGSGETDATIALTDEVLPRLTLPFQLSNYELLEQIGTGAHGVVFRARHLRLEREVAVKLLLHASQPFVEEFLNEMRIIGRLDHPNIIRATDAGEHEGTYFLVMDYVSGLDVSTLLLRTGPLRVSDACEIARQTALGLAFAHQHQLVHRDVKTSNLLFTANGQIKLLDLGLATITSRLEHRPSNNPRSGPRGTADYMAPEQWIEASRVSAKADLYSLGCTLFKLLTGETPYRTLPDGVQSKEDAHRDSPIPSIGQYRRDVPSQLEALIAQLLFKSAEQRPASAQEVADRLAGFTDSADLPALVEQFCPELERTVVPAATPPIRSKKRTRRNLLLGAALACSAAFVLRLRLPNTSKGIDTGIWRVLSPSTPSLLPLAEEGDSYLEELGDRLLLSSTETTLLHFGSPLTTPYRWVTELSRENWRNSAGIFFRLRKDTSGALDFHSLQLQGTDDTSSGLLLWSAHRAGDHGNTTKVLGETSLQLRPGGSNTLDVVIGRAGFPDIRVNESRLGQSQWTLATEAREFVVANLNKLSELFAGRIGVMQTSGVTTITSSQLMYLD